MAEQVNIASLTINIDDVTKNSVKLKKQLDGLRQEQRELAKTGQSSTEAFIQNDISIRKLSKSYKDSQQLATALESSNSDLDKALSSQNKSTQELYDSRSELQKIAKNIIGDTDEEIAQREKLNNAIDEQTAAIRGQGSQYVVGKDRIGEYKDNILEANEALENQKNFLEDMQKELIKNQKSVDKNSDEYKDLSAVLKVVDEDLEDVNKEIDLGNGYFETFTGKVEDSGGALGALAGGMKKASTATGGLTKATKLLILVPLFLILAAIVGVFLLVKNAMNRNEESSNKLKKAFAAFGGIISALMKILEPLGEFLIDGLVVAFETLEKVISATLAGIETALEFVGLENAAKKMNNFNNEIAEGSKAAKELAQAEAELIKSRRVSQKLQLDYQKAAEKARQLRDDERRSIAQRKKDNQELGLILKKQSREELAIANQALKVANLRVQLDGENSAALDERAEALTEISDIQERITGQESEQLVNLVSLNKEATALAKERAEKEKEIADKKKEADAEIADKKIEDAQIAADKAIEIAKYELNEYIRVNKSKLDSDKFLTAESVKEEKNRLELLAAERRAFANTQLLNGQITQLEFNAKINEINDQDFEAKKEIDNERNAAEKERKAIDFDNELEIKELQNQSEFEIQTERLEASRVAEVESAEKTGADINLINEKYAAQQKIIDEISENERLSSAEATFGGVAKLLGEHTAAGKAAGIAQATINTYQGVTEVLKATSVLPEPLATISKVVNTGVVLGSGLKAVGKIKATKLATGGKVKGAGSGKSDSIPTLLSVNESVINANSTSMFAGLLSDINVAGGGVPFATGGVAGSSSSSSISSSLIDVDLLAAKIGEANSKLPAPQVSTVEFTKVANKVKVVENLASE